AMCSRYGVFTARSLGLTTNLPEPTPYGNCWAGWHMTSAITSRQSVVSWSFPGGRAFYPLKVLKRWLAGLRRFVRLPMKSRSISFLQIIDLEPKIRHHY